MPKPVTDASPDRIDNLKLRPGERVLQYLLQEFNRLDLKDGARLPSNRELARRLNVSVPTVQSVLKGLNRDGRIQSRHGSGTYLLSHAQISGGPRRIVVAAVLQADGKMSDSWLNTVISGLMQTALTSFPTTFVGIAPEKFGTDESVPALLDEIPNADGLIILPFALIPKHRDQITAAYEKAKKPVVHLELPFATATSNFVSSDYFSPAEALGQIWSKTGRRHIMLVSSGVKYEFAMASHLRLMGLASGIGEALGSSTSLRVLPAASTPEKSYALMKEILNSGESVPDAILLTSGAARSAIVRAIQEHGLKIPRDVSIVTTEALHAPEGYGHEGHMTLIHEPALALSRLLMEMLFERINQRGAPLHGKYLPSKIICGNSTRPQENKLLQNYAVTSKSG
jgi:DNA-binding LacI/PurR family transcriptional regulator